MMCSLENIPLPYHWFKLYYPDKDCCSWLRRPESYRKDEGAQSPHVAETLGRTSSVKCQSPVLMVLLTHPGLNNSDSGRIGTVPLISLVAGGPSPRARLMPWSWGKFFLMRVKRWGWTLKREATLKVSSVHEGILCEILNFSLEDLFYLVPCHFWVI